MIILSKANLVDEGIDLDEIKNLIRKEPIVVGENNGRGFSTMFEDLRWNHDIIQTVYNIDFQFHHLFYSIIQPPSLIFAKPSLTN